MKFFNKAVILFLLFTMIGGVCFAQRKKMDPLDAAIRETSDYLYSKIAKGNKIVILSIQSESGALSEYIIDELISNTVNDSILLVVDRQQLDAIRAEQNFQFSGEVDDKQAIEIGKLFGAQSIVSGSIGLLGNEYRLRIRSLEVQTALVQGQFNKNIAKSNLIPTLMVSKASGTATAASAPKPAATPAPAQQAAPAAAPVTIPSTAPAGQTIIIYQNSNPAPAAATINYKIGDFGPAGGIIFYDKGSVSNGWRYLEAASAETEVDAEWGAQGQDVKGTSTAIGSGKKNTQLIVQHMNSQKRRNDFGKAAQVCMDLDIDGYKDWFLPSKDELDLMFKNLKAKDLGGFEKRQYWSSSQKEKGDAYALDFNSRRGDFNTRMKYDKHKVRAIRAF